MIIKKYVGKNESEATDEAKKELYALVRKKEGTKYVSVEVIDALTLELMGQLEKKDKDIKNSESSPT